MVRRIEEKNESVWVPEKLWEKFRESFPIVCVDAIIVKDGKVLLLKRVNAPVRGEWWIPGGRVRKWETLEDTLTREVKGETGLDITTMEFLGIFSLMSTKDDMHTVNITYVVEVEGDITLNDEHDDFKWVSTFGDLHPYIQKVMSELKKK